MGLKDEVIATVARVTKVSKSELTEASGLGVSAGWDSLAHTSLIIELENQFDLDFDFDELDRIVTVEKIILALEAKGLTR